MEPNGRFLNYVYFIRIKRMNNNKYWSLSRENNMDIPFEKEITFFVKDILILLTILMIFVSILVSMIFKYFIK